MLTKMIHDFLTIVRQTNKKSQLLGKAHLGYVLKIDEFNLTQSLWGKVLIFRPGEFDLLNMIDEVTTKYTLLIVENIIQFTSFKYLDDMLGIIVSNKSIAYLNCSAKYKFPCPLYVLWLFDRKQQQLFYVVKRR